MTLDPFSVLREGLTYFARQTVLSPVFFGTVALILICERLSPVDPKQSPYSKKYWFVKNAEVLRALKRRADRSASVKILRKELFWRVLKNLFAKPPYLSQLMRTR